MKSNAVYKRAYNAALDRIKTHQAGERVPTETDLSNILKVSRTTVRKVLSHLIEEGYVVASGKDRRLSDMIITPTAYFPTDETVPTSTQVESRFMERIRQGDAKPGMILSELDLARQFDVGTTSIREFLSRFSRFGLIEKRVNGGWLFRGFTPDFAAELLETRELFEVRSARAFSHLRHDDPAWDALRALRREHELLLLDIDRLGSDFIDLDNRFHRTITAALPNRFIDDFYDIISFIIQYNYQRDARGERERNKNAIAEHLAYIDALLKRDQRMAEAACRRHLSSGSDWLSMQLRRDYRRILRS